MLFPYPLASSVTWALFQRENVARANPSVLSVKTLYTQQLVNLYPCHLAHVADMQILVFCCYNSALCLLFYVAPLCLTPLFNVLGNVPKIVLIFVHGRTCVVLHTLTLAVVAILVHVSRSLAWKTVDDCTRLAFWEHTADISQEVSIHLGIF